MTVSMTLNDAKVDTYVIIASLKKEQTCKLIIRISGSKFNSLDLENAYS